MPELPEVETVCRGIAPHVTGKRIATVTVHDRRLRWPVPAGFEKRLRGRTIMGVSRRAKYLLLALDSGDRVILHLGMTGRLFLARRNAGRVKHDHLDLDLGDSLLRFHDPRRFGAALLWRAGEADHRLLRNLGPEPLSALFDGDYLFARSRKRQAPVKAFLMDGRIVVGVGNIYASEALFRAGIRPGRAAGRVTRAEYARLAKAVRTVLREAIRQGGTTLKDSAFSDPLGAFGYFQVRLKVYDREGEACPACRVAIRRQTIGQRSSFYCPSCQK